MDFIDLRRILTSQKFSGWTADQFTELCVLAGCDYLRSLPGVGIKTAYNTIRAKQSIHAALTHFQQVNSACNAQYVDHFKQALLTFGHQRVYDPQSKRMVPLTPFKSLDLKLEPHDFLGPPYSDDVCRNIAECRLHPETRQPYHVNATALAKVQPRYRYDAKNKMVVQSSGPAGIYVYRASASSADHVLESKPEVENVSNSRKLAPPAQARRTQQFKRAVTTSSAGTGLYAMWE